MTSVAVCFLHAWRDAAHERAARAVLRRIMPDAYLSVSSEVLPEFRECDRFSTTVLNAIVGPRMATDPDRLLAQVRDTGIATAPCTVHSHGGLMSVATAAQAPVRTCLSGPAARSRPGRAARSPIRGRRPTVAAGRSRR